MRHFGHIPGRCPPSLGLGRWDPGEVGGGAGEELVFEDGDRTGVSAVVQWVKNPTAAAQVLKRHRFHP